MNEVNFKYFYFLLVAVWALIIIRLGHLQIIKHTFFSAQASTNIYKFYYLDSPRGLILDTRGRVLVGNLVSFCGGAQIPFSKKASVRNRSLNWYSQQLLNELNLQKDNLVSNPKELLVESCNLSLDQAAKILKLRANDKNFFLRIKYLRHSEATETSHITGYLHQKTQNDLGEVLSQGKAGLTGIEGCLEEFLRGVEGIVKSVFNVRAERVSSKVIRKPRPGLDVTLTINLAWQSKAIELLNKNSGVVIVLEPETGFIRVLASNPVFDPNIFNLNDKEKIIEVLNSLSRPLLNRAINGIYPPGSITKPLVVLGLSNVKFENKFCPGFDVIDRVRIHCHKRDGHGAVSMSDALIKSCDVYFYKLSQIISYDDIVKTYQIFNLTEPTGLDCFTETRSRLLHRYEVKHSVNLEKALLLIGQGSVAVTPLQMAVAYASLVNGGKIVKPTIIERITSKSGEFDIKVRPVIKRVIDIDQSKLKETLNALFKVVNSPEGTAYTARSNMITFSGKTGTAQVVSLKRKGQEKKFEHHAWFAGFWPSENPKYVIVVLVEHGGSGGKIAAPIARDLIEFIEKNEAN